jgi:MATE family multidrug resistance protein
VIRRDDVRESLRLALPVVLTQLGSMAMGTVDTLMAGRLGPEAISAVGLGSSIGFAPLIIGMGTLMGLDPVVAQAFGARDFARCGRAMRHGLLIAAMLSLPIMAILWQARFILTHLGEPPELVDARRHSCRLGASARYLSWFSPRCASSCRESASSSRQCGSCSAPTSSTSSPTGC